MILKVDLIQVLCFLLQKCRSVQVVSGETSPNWNAAAAGCYQARPVFGVCPVTTRQPETQRQSWKKNNTCQQILQILVVIFLSWLLKEVWLEHNLIAPLCFHIDVRYAR